MFTFASTLTAAGAIGACSDSSSAVALYGQPCDSGCGAEDDGGLVNDAGGAQPLYGLADATFVEDSGSPGDAATSDSGDAGADAD